MAKFTKKKKIAALTTALVVVGTGGAAFAYWTNSGTGAGTAATGTNVGITVNQTSSISAMYPGEAARTLSGNFTNTNAGSTYVTAVQATGFSIDATSLAAGCTAASYTLGGSAPVAAQVANGTGGSWTGLTLTMNNLPATNQDPCKNATVTVSYTSS